MDDNVLFLLRNCFTRDHKNVIDELPSKVWDKCRQIIFDFREDNDLNDLLKQSYTEQWQSYLNGLFTHLWRDFVDGTKLAMNVPNSHHLYIFSLVQTIDESIIKWFNNRFLDSLFDGKSEQLKKDYIAILQSDLFTAFVADMPLPFSSCLLNTFLFSFEVFNDLYIKRDSETFGVLLFQDHHIESCKLSNSNDQVCHCQSLKDGFFAFRNSLCKLGLFNELCRDVIKSVIYTSIETFIVKLCKDEDLDVDGLEAVNEFFHKNITYWTKLILFYDIDCKDNLEVKRILNDSIYQDDFDEIVRQVDIEHLDFKKSFENIYLYTSHNIEKYIVNTYVYCRLQKLFEIVLNYPSSERILIDLNNSIKFDPFYRKKFISSLKSSFENRLLHPGVSTNDIIEAYVTSIKALRLLDPQGVILQIVCDPVRNYLKNRDDTIRCIITMLTSDTIPDLRDASDAESNDTGEDEEFLQDKWKTWDPNPIGVNNVNKTLIKSDIISMLVNIFDSKDLFAQVYQKLVSQRLLSTFEVDLILEHRNLEILSLRFGEHELHNCEVMLKDIKDSARINQRVNDSDSSLKFYINAFILSEQFWPENFGFSNSCDELKAMKLPEEVDESLKNYTKAFETIKANRTIKWVHQLGTVKLNLHFDNGQSQEFNVRPVQAVIIHAFQNKQTWQVCELAEELNVAPSLIRRHIKFWNGIGLLTQLGEDRFLLDEAGYVSNSCPKSQMNAHEFEDSEVDEMTGNKSIDSDYDSRFAFYWNYIDNMLTNLSALSLDRIFQMLKILNRHSTDADSLTMHELKQFLDRKVGEGKLVYASGQYSIKPSS